MTLVDEPRTSQTADNTVKPLLADFYGFQHELSETEQAHIGELRAFLDAEVAPIINGYWARAEFPMQIVPKLAELGCFGAFVPEVQKFENSALYRGWAAMELGRVDASVATFAGVQSGLAMGAIHVGGSPEQQTVWLPQMARGELLGSFGLTEPYSGSDSAKGLRTVAVRDGDDWVLTGAKRWIGNATFADIVVIFAKDAADGQVKGFVVDTKSAGFTATKIEDKIALRSVQNADILLDGVRVPEGNRLPNIRSFRDVATVLRLTRAEVAWESVGVAIGAYEAAVAYARERMQFGKLIGGTQLVQDLLVKSLGNITASIAMCVQLSKLQDVGAQSEEQSALAKAYVTARMRETVAWCREAMGGNGIVLDNNVARFFSDAEALYSYEGTQQMNTLIVGRAITGQAAFV